MELSRIVFDQFSFKYDAQKEPTLKNINLVIEQGEKVLIAGPSGSGKSTLGHCINGLIPFSYKGDMGGTLLIGDLETKTSDLNEINKYVGTVLQDQDGQFVGLSVGEDVAFYYENHNVEKKDMITGVETALRNVDMLEYINETPHNLSGGQKQRVSLAGILTCDTDILLFDEPLANLDPASSKHALDLIDEIQAKSNKTIIVIEHRIEDVLAHDFDRVIVMNGGCIIADQKPDALLPGSILTDAGLREPLYVEALKNMGVDLTNQSRLSDITSIDVYSDNVKAWFEASQSGQRKSLVPALSVENVNFKYFADGPQILKNVNFAIAKNEITAIMGNNGAGKSTLLKVISGLEKPQSGSIKLDGHSIDKWSIMKRSEKIGYVMQNPNHMITKIQIYDEVAFGLRNKGVSEEEIKVRVNHTLKVCGLYRFRNWPVSALSYGQKKRVTIASILAMNPEIIILDEPTAGQDFRNYTEFMSFLKAVKDEGVSIVIITHDMQLAMEYADRAVVLSEGTVIKEDSVASVMSSHEVMTKANLRGTTLSSLAEICGIKDVGQFLENYIKFSKEVTA